MMGAMETFARRGGDLAILDRMVQVYTAHKVTSRWVKPYVEDPSALAAALLWSDTFRERAHEVH